MKRVEAGLLGCKVRSAGRDRSLELTIKLTSAGVQISDEVSSELFEHGEAEDDVRDEVRGEEAAAAEDVCEDGGGEQEDKPASGTREPAPHASEAGGEAGTGGDSSLDLRHYTRPRTPGILVLAPLQLPLHDDVQDVIHDEVPGDDGLQHGLVALHPPHVGLLVLHLAGVRADGAHVPVDAGHDLPADLLLLRHPSLDGVAVAP